jgi:predicted dehydrogenase
MVGESSQAKSAARRRLRLGMVGGGQGAFIGGVHRIAARLDDRYELVAGCFSSTEERSKASAVELGVDPARAYASFAEMARREKRRKDGIDVVSIVTPNHVHFPAAKAFLDAGTHVICDKPLTTNLKDARRLADLVASSGRVFVLTHNYTGYPMVRQAHAMVEAGELGRIRVVQAEYVQDWLSTPLEATGQKQAEWRTDPKRSGPAGCTGDIATHAMNLACFITGLELESLCSELSAFVDGRVLDDNVQMMLRFKGGARGGLWASQVAPGNENALRVRVYGEKAGLAWAQEDPNYLTFTPLGEPPRLIRRAGAGAGALAGRVSRIPAGHPEGYLEGFATIYSDAAEQIWAAIEGREADPAAMLTPTVLDGVRGVKFIEAAVESSRKGGTWVKAAI